MRAAATTWGSWHLRLLTDGNAFPWPASLPVGNEDCVLLTFVCFRSLAGGTIDIPLCHWTWATASKMPSWKQVGYRGMEIFKQSLKHHQTLEFPFLHLQSYFLTAPVELQSHPVPKSTKGKNLNSSNKRSKTENSVERELITNANLTITSTSLQLMAPLRNSGLLI